MNFKFGFFAFALVFVGLFFLTGTGSAAVLNTCTDINADYLGTAHTLGSNISGDDWNGSCFTLSVAADNNSFELDCLGNDFVPDVDATNIFDTNGFAINRVTFRNCILTNAQLNSIFYIDADVNTAEFLDAVGSVNMDDFTIADVNIVTDTQLDFNFNGTDFNLAGDNQNSPLGFYLNNADIGTINIYDFNVDYDSNWLDTDNTGYPIFGEAALFKFDGNSDVNFLNVISTNGSAEISITQGNLFDFFESTEGTLDINFSGTPVTINDSNSIGFHLDMSTYSTLTLKNISLIADAVDLLVKVEGPGVDLNTLSFVDSILTMTPNNGFFGLVSAPDTFLSFDFNDTNVDFINFEGFSLDLSAMGTTSFLNINTGSDINAVVFDGASNIVQSSGTFVSILTGDPNGIDFEFSNAIFELGLVNSIFDINTVAGTISNLGINNFYINSVDKNIFTVTDTTISSFNVVDSNLNTSANGLISLDATSSVVAGLITNNIFRYDISAPLVFTNAPGSFLADFNDVVAQNQDKRNVFGFSSDNSPWAGGNLWLNPVSGDNWCTLDTLSPKGICDGFFNILGTDNNYVDFVAVVSYRLPDLNVTTIDSNDAYIRLNEDVNLTATIFNNRTNSTADLNYYVTFDINNDDSIDLNSLVTTDLNFAQSVQVSYIWDANQNGDIDVNVCVSYLDGINATDNDASNDCNIATFHVYTVDFSANAVTFSDNTLVYPEVQDINFSFSNQGDANAESDYNIIYYINDDENANYNFTEDLNYGNSDSNIYSWTSNGYYTDANVYVCIVYNGTDENSSANNCTQQDLNVFYRDVNVSDIVPTTTTPVYGDTIDFNVLIGNQGDYNSNLVDVNLYVIKGATTYTWTLNDQNITAGTIQTLNLGEWDVNLIGNIDLNVVVTPSEADYNNDNHTRLESVGLVVTYVDLNAYDIDVNDSSIVYGDVVDINVDYINSGDANADANYYVLYYIDAVLDANYLITEDLNSSSIDTNNYVWTSDIAGDVNVYVCLDYTETDYNSNDDCTQQTLTVLSVDLNGTSLSLDDSSVTTGATVVATFTYGNQGDANATATYDTTVYLSGTSQCTDANTTDLIIDGTATFSCSFTAPSTPGTYTVSGIADYSGYDNNADNNSASATLTVTAAPVTNSPGGGGTSGATNNTSADSTEYTFNYGVTESSLYIETVEVNYKAGEKESANLKVILPNIADADKITDEEVTVIKYLELKYSGDQSKIENAIVTFTVGKDEASDPALVKLGRLKDGVWTYFTPSSYKDNGTFYTFNVEVPGFSYFAIVLKAIEEPTVQPTSESSKDIVVGETESSNTEPTATPDTTPTPSEGLAWWIWTIIAVVVVVVIVFIVMGLRK